MTPAADRLEPRGAAVLPPGGLRLNNQKKAPPQAADPRSTFDRVERSSPKGSPIDRVDRSGIP